MAVAKAVRLEPALSRARENVKIRAYQILQSFPRSASSGIVACLLETVEVLVKLCRAMYGTLL